MGHNKGQGQVEFSADGATVTFRPVPPRNGTGVLLLAVSLAGFLTYGLAEAVFGEGNPHAMHWADTGLGWGLVCGVGGLGRAIFLASRRYRTVLTCEEAVLENGWAIWQARSYALSEFVGLRRLTRAVLSPGHLLAQFGCAVAGAVAGGLLFGFDVPVAPLAGMLVAMFVFPQALSLRALAFLRPRLVHLLELRHRNNSLRILLATDPDAAEIDRLAKDLGERFPLPLMVPTLHGLAAGAAASPQNPQATTTEAKGSPGAAPIGDAVGVAAGESPPPNLTVRHEGGSIRIRMPRPSSLLVLGLPLAVGAISVAVWCSEPIGEPALNRLTAAVTALLGCFGLVLGVGRLLCPGWILMDEQALASRMVWFGGKSVIPWRIIRQVTVARVPPLGVQGLLFQTDVGEFAPVSGLPPATLQWILQLIGERGHIRQAPPLADDSFSSSGR